MPNQTSRIANYRYCIRWCLPILPVLAARQKELLGLKCTERGLIRSVPFCSLSPGSLVPVPVPVPVPCTDLTGSEAFLLRLQVRLIISKANLLITSVPVSACVA